MTFREWKITNYYYNGVRSVKAYFSFKKNIDLKSYFSRYTRLVNKRRVTGKRKSFSKPSICVLYGLAVSFRDFGTYICMYNTVDQTLQTCKSRYTCSFLIETEHDVLLWSLRDIKATRAGKTYRYLLFCFFFLETSQSVAAGENWRVIRLANSTGWKTKANDTITPWLLGKRKHLRGTEHDVIVTYYNVNSFEKIQSSRAVAPVLIILQCVEGGCAPIPFIVISRETDINTL